VSHLAPLSEEEANRLLGMVVDVENIFMSMHREEDADTKRVYYYLFKVCPVITLSYQWPCSSAENHLVVLLINIHTHTHTYIYIYIYIYYRDAV